LAGEIVPKPIRQLNLFRQHALEKLDPRIGVTSIVSAKQIQHILTPKVDITFNLIFDKKRIDPEHIDKFLRGYEIDVPPGSVRIEGSGLLELLAKVGGKLQSSLSYKGSIRFVRVDSQKIPKHSLPFMDCHFEGGPIEIRYSCSTPYNLLSFQGVLRYDGARPCPMCFKMSTKGWHSRKLLDLYLFDEVHGFLFDRKYGDCIVMEVMLPDLEPASVEGPDFTGWTEIRGFYDYIEILRISRFIAKTHGKNPILPEVISDELAISLQAFRDLMSDRPVRLELVPAMLRMGITREEKSRMLKDCNTNMPINIYSPCDYVGCFFDDIDVAIECSRFFTNLMIWGGEEKLREIEPDADGTLWIEFTSTPETIHGLIRKPPEINPPLISL